MNSLNSNQLDYIIFHLKQHVKIDEEWPIVHSLSKESLLKMTKGAIVFPHSKDEINLKKKVEFMGKQIPILFTTSDEDRIFYIDSNGNLIFHHDILRSAFYILSGYQEVEEPKLDEYDRYSYSDSIQKKLDIVTLPVVNYYFEMIIQGLEEYCNFHSFKIKRKRLFDQLGFFLSHDVDRVAFYHPKEVAFKIKQIIGLAPLTYNYRLTILLFLKGFIHILSPFKKKDPWWNFDWMMQMEKKLNIRSTFFFLKQEHKNRDSRYQFSDAKIKILTKELTSQGFEVGLHGSFNSSDNPAMLSQQADELSRVLGYSPKGIRQHFLRFKHPATFKHQIEAGLKYDCTLAFAEHDGYRNGYCYPFRPYDFENDQMLDIWEIPLTMMEVSMLNYRKVNLDEFRLSVLHHIEEAKKFGGLFSLLWHNCRLMNEEFPDIEEFYPNLLKQIVELGAEALTGEEVVGRMGS